MTVEQLNVLMGWYGDGSGHKEQCRVLRQILKIGDRIGYAELKHLAQSLYEMEYHQDGETRGGWYAKMKMLGWELPERLRDISQV